MKPLLIELPTQRGTCRSCGAAIEWATTASGARMPFNPPVVTFPNVLALDYHEVDRARSISHFATCPQAAAWRTRKTAAR